MSSIPPIVGFTFIGATKNSSYCMLYMSLKVRQSSSGELNNAEKI